MPLADGAPDTVLGVRVTWNRTTPSPLTSCGLGVTSTCSHVAFSVPHELIPSALQNRRVFYDLLFEASAETLLAVASDPRHLATEIGFFSVLYTCNQKARRGYTASMHCCAFLKSGSKGSEHWMTLRSQLPVTENLPAIPYFAATYCTRT